MRLTDFTRLRGEDFKKIKNIEQVFKRLNINCYDMPIKHYELQMLIDDSLELISKIENNPYEHGTFIVDLISYWGAIPNGSKYQATKINEFKKSFFSKNLLHRILYLININFNV